jgi:hypothetical protein
MTLQHPFFISSRLLPAIKIGGTTVSLEQIGCTSDGRDEYQIWFDMPDGTEIRESGLRSGCNGASTIRFAIQGILIRMCKTGETFMVRRADFARFTFRADVPRT